MAGVPAGTTCVLAIPAHLRSLTHTPDPPLHSASPLSLVKGDGSARCRSRYVGTEGGRQGQGELGKSVGSVCARAGPGCPAEWGVVVDDKHRSRGTHRVKESKERQGRWL